MITSEQIYRAIRNIEKIMGRRGTFFSATALSKAGQKKKFCGRFGVKHEADMTGLSYNRSAFNHVVLYDTGAAREVREGKRRQPYRTMIAHKVLNLKAYGHVLVKDGKPTELGAKLMSKNLIIE